jgi:O-methyltransferase domain/Dimerisation domain
MEQGASSMKHASRIDRTPESDVAPSADGIMQLGFGFRGAKALLSAVELDLFTELAVAPGDAETLRQRLGLDERGARDFFDALVALGMLERQHGIYRNTPETDFYLDRKKPSYIGGIFRLASARLYQNYGLLTEALRTGRPQNEVANGEDLFGKLYSDPESAAEFAQAMTGLSLPIAHALARRFPWSDYRTLLDVGTAQGVVPVEIALVHAHLAGGGLDLPQVRPVFESYVRRRGLEHRLQFYASNFLDEPLPGADVLVMGHVLHNWSLAVKRELLTKAHAALPKGGALIVYDRMIDDARRENAAGLLMSLSMLVETSGGFDYTGADCIGWMEAAGFKKVGREHLCGSCSMVVGTK